MEIHSLQEYINSIEILKRNYTYEQSNGLQSVFETHYTVQPKFIYRGHSDHDKYKLLPGVFRKIKTVNGSTTEYSQLEFNILSDFISESKRYFKDIPSYDIKSWLEIAQHFAVPTRLLDFSQNPLVALYFACCNLSEKTASVWILNEANYTQKIFNTMLILESNVQELIGNIINQEIVNFGRIQNGMNFPYPIIYRPIYWDERMSDQSSVFMLWGTNRCELNKIIDESSFMSFEDSVTNASNGILGNVLIPSEYKKTIITQLNEVGINEKFIFPGLDGVGKYIKHKYHV